MKAALRTRLAAIVLVVLAAAGCRDGGPSGPEGVPSVESYGRLPGLRQAADPQLQSELARIVEEGGAPEQLERTEIPPENNVATGLARLFLPTRVEATFDESGEIFPQGRFAFNPVRLQKAIEFRKKFETQNQHAREALGRPECRFAIHYQAGFFEADLGFIDVVRTCARLEAFRAAESLQQDDPSSAIEALGYMFRLAACLAAEKHVTCRMKAVFLRTEALAVLAAIVEHKDVTREHIEQLRVQIDQQLAGWPSDAEAWIGDRALGMHAYELVRAGRLGKLLTPAEVQQFHTEGILKELPAAAQRTVNEDELYYLRTMRKIIDHCSQPYYARVAMFQAIRQDQQETRNSPEFPVVAARLLLVDIEKGHSLQAQDRAACEAWALALALAAGAKQPAYRVNPLSGQEYQVKREQGVILVWNVLPGDAADHPTVLVPDLAEAPPGE